MSVEQILDSSPSGMGDFVDQVIEIKGAEFGTSQYGPNVKLTLQNGDGEESTVTTGAEAIVRKVKALADGGHLPVRAKVITYSGQFGNPGYDLRSMQPAQRELGDDDTPELDE